MQVKLKDISTFINGRAYLMPEIQKSGKYRIVRVGNFSGKDEWFYSDMELESNKYCVKGDLLYKWACNFGPEIWLGEKAIYHYHIWKIIVDETKINKLFLYYLLKVMTPYWLSSTNGSTMIHITKEIMEDKFIELPSISIQNKIISVLSSIDSQIERNNAIVKRLQVLAQAIYTHWFLQFEFPNDEGKPYKSSGGKMIWNDKLKRELPEGWEMKNIKELCDITWGQCPDGNNILPLDTKENNTIKYCSGAGDMRNGLLVDCQAKTNASKRYANKGDVLMSIAGSIGALTIVDEKISLGRAAMAFTPKKCTKLFAYLAIKSLVDRIKQVASGSIQKVINDNHINDMNIPYNEIVFKMFEKYNGIIEEEIILSKENQMLISLRNVLLPLLINNQLQ